MRRQVQEKITRAVVEEALQKKALQYDKGGEEHYNLISAFHKSLRGTTLTPPFTGWAGCLQPAKTLFTLPGAW